MLKTKGIDHVNFQVIDLEATYQFYHTLFGFEILKRQPLENSYIIGNQTMKICIYEVPGMRRYSRSSGFNHFGICVENYDEVMETLKRNNVDFQHGERYFQWENSRSVYIYDPNGYGIDIVDVWGGGLDK